MPSVPLTESRESMLIEQKKLMVITGFMTIKDSISLAAKYVGAPKILLPSALPLIRSSLDFG